MSSPLKRSGPGRPGPRSNGKARPRLKIDHADIVRMATAESMSRAAERRDMIATAAYFRAQKRGFEPGHELEDWLGAETEIAHAQQLNMIATGADSP